MKKNLIIAIFVLSTFQLMAQIGQPFSKPVTIMWSQTGNVQHLSIGQDAENSYLYETETDVSKKNFTDHLFVFNNKTLTSKDITINVPGRYHIIGGINQEKQILAFYLYENSKAGTIAIMSGAINKKGTSETISGEQLCSFTSESKSFPTVFTSTSPNGEKYGIALLITDKKDNFKSLYTVVINKQGEVDWEKNFLPEFGNPQFSIEDMQVANDGSLFVPAFSMVTKGNNVSNVKFHLIQINGETAEMNTTDADFGAPQHIKALVMKSGEVFVAGYYSKSYRESKDEALGYFCYKFDPKSSTYTVQKHESFPSSYRQREIAVFAANVLANQQYELTCNYLFELENGNVALCGEHKFMKLITDQNGQRSYILMNKNIPVTIFTPDGNSTFTMIEKSQAANSAQYTDDYHDMYLSYTAFPYKDQICFIYNEDADNVPYPGKGKLCQTYAIKIAKDLKGVCTILHADQTISQQVLTSAETNAQLLHKVQFVNGDSFFVTAGSKSGFCLDKFTVK